MSTAADYNSRRDVIWPAVVCCGLSSGWVQRVEELSSPNQLKVVKNVNPSSLPCLLEGIGLEEPVRYKTSIKYPKNQLHYTLLENNIHRIFKWNKEGKDIQFLYKTIICLYNNYPTGKWLNRKKKRLANKTDNRHFILETYTMQLENQFF